MNRQRISFKLIRVVPGSLLITTLLALVVMSQRPGGLRGLSGLLGWGTAPPQAPEPSRKVPRLEPYGHLPLSFEANKGQTDGQVQFLAHGQGYTLFITAREALFAFRPPAAHGQRPTGLAPKPTAVQNTLDTARAVVHMQLLGVNPAPQSVGLEELPGKVNYFIGSDPQKWRTHVPTYAKVQYTGVYPGVDLVYYGRSSQLEYDFVVAPGADPPRSHSALKASITST